MPLAFFCTLFFRHRKKSVSAPWDGQSQSAPESARQAQPGAGDCACGRTGGFPLAPSPLRFASRSNRAPHRAASPAPAPESVRQAPTKGNFLRQGCLLSCKQGAFRSPPAPLRAVVGEKTQGLSSGQTLGAVRTAVRSACCLPELRGANRLRRLCPLGDGELFKFNLKSSVCQRQTGLPKGNPPCVFPSFPPAPLRGVGVPMQGYAPADALGTFPVQTLSRAFPSS